MQFSGLSLRYRDFGIALLVLALAFALRGVVLVDRYHDDPLFSPLPAGSDQLTYVKSALAYEAGQFPTAPFRYQPGFIYFLVGVRKLVGTNLMVDRLALILTDTLACGLLIGAGWLLTRRRWGGLLTGLLYALYPVAIFYSTEFLLEGLALFYVCLFLFLTLWQRERRSLLRTALIGAVLGLTTITRTNLALLLLAWLFWLWLIEPDRRRVALHAAVTLGMTAAMIAPVTLWNLHMGSSQLITNVGVDEIHRADSRDSDGTYLSWYRARGMVEGDYGAALLNDIRRDPLHFVAIQARKLGLYWSDSEPANNIDYYVNGEDVSPLLRALPLDFRILSALGLLGTFALWLVDRRAGLFFAALHLLIFAGVMIIWVISRVRLPAVAPLLLTTAFLLVWLRERLRAGAWRSALRQLAPAALAVAALLIFCGWAIDHALVKHPASAIPADAQPGDIVFDGKLKLAGWRWLDEWPAALRGWAQPKQTYGVELFWQVLAPTDKDYVAYVAYIQDGIRYAAHDAPIGTVSRPMLPTSQWQPGEIYSEIMGFKFPNGVPLATTGAIHLGVYTFAGGLDAPERTMLPVAITSDPTATGDLVLQSLAVFDPNVTPTPLPELTTANLVFGGAIALQGFQLPDDGAPGSAGVFAFHWQALADVSADDVLFIHVMDQAGQLQASYDAPVGGTLLSSNWAPGYPVYEELTLTLPSAPGDYQVYIGLYDPATRERLAVDAPDNRPLLGTIHVG